MGKSLARLNKWQQPCPDLHGGVRQSRTLAGRAGVVGADHTGLLALGTRSFGLLLLETPKQASPAYLPEF